MSKKKKIIIAVIVVFIIAALGNDNKSEKTDSTEKAITTNESSTTAEVFAPEEEPSTVTKVSAPEGEQSVSEEEPSTVTEASAPEGEPSVQKEENNMDIHFMGNVAEDTTGNWRLSTTTDTKAVEDYALDYYKTYFKSDSEIHAIVNFSLNTTTCISNLGGLLDVTVHEYVDGEEHSAKELFGGAVLAEYMINTDDGSVEKIQ